MEAAAEALKVFPRRRALAVRGAGSHRSGWPGIVFLGRTLASHLRHPVRGKSRIIAKII